MTLNRSCTLVLSPWNRLSTPIPRSNRCRGAIRGGLVTSSSVPSAGIRSRVAPPPDVRSSVIGAVARRDRAAAEEADRGLLVAGQRERVVEAADRAGDEARVVPPAERGPGAVRLVEDVLQVRRRVELLIVVDPEVAGRLLEENAAGAGRREDRVGVRHHDERAEAVVLDEVEPAGEAVDPRVIPRDRERRSACRTARRSRRRCRCAC